jgi:hypothetical protein
MTENLSFLLSEEGKERLVGISEPRVVVALVCGWQSEAKRLFDQAIDNPETVPPAFESNQCTASSPTR